MSSGKNPLTQEQKTFEIEERVYKLLPAEFRSKYILYRKIPSFPENQKQNYSIKTAEYLDTIASKIATNFILNSNKQPLIEEDTIIEDRQMTQNNINMQDLAQLIANAISTAMNNCCIMVIVIQKKVETKIKKQFGYFLRLIFISVLS